MGEFALNAAIAYQTGAARGDHSILSAMDIDEAEFFAVIGQSVNDLILRHRKHLETKRETRSVELKIESRWLEATSTAAGPKGRWVDGTPEYSFHIWGLRKLFPKALFIHVLRDVRAVVHSMVNFHRVAGIHLVANEEEAYRYWIRTVGACQMAECAYGPHVVHRTRYGDLSTVRNRRCVRCLNSSGSPTQQNVSSRCRNGSTAPTYRPILHPKIRQQIQ